MELIIYKEYVEWFEALDFYQEYMSKFPEPFNNPAFASAVVLVIMFFLFMSVFEHLRNWRIRKRIKRKNRELELKRLEIQMKEEDHRKRVSEMEEYMRFMMMAQMQNMNSLLGMSFEQWRCHRFGYAISEPVIYQSIEPEKEEAGTAEAEKMVEEPVVESEVSVDELPEEVTEVVTPDEECMLQEMPEVVPDVPTYAGDEEELPELPLVFKEEKDTSEATEEVENSVGLTHCELPKESIVSDGLTEEQQSDFAKLIAMMQAQEKQKEQIGEYNKQRSEITKNNMEVLDRGLQAAPKTDEKRKHGKNSNALDKRKQAALEALEADKQKEAGKASGEKRKLFSGRK